MENVSIKKYGIKDGNSSVVFSVDKVIELLVANADMILKNEGGKLVCPYADMYASAKLHEHGLVVEIDEDMLNNSRLRKISLALFSKKRELLNSKKELVQMKKTSYFSKLEGLLLEQKKVNK